MERFGLSLISVSNQLAIWLGVRYLAPSFK